MDALYSEPQGPHIKTEGPYRRRSPSLRWPVFKYMLVMKKLNPFHSSFVIRVVGLH